MEDVMNKLIYVHKEFLKLKNLNRCEHILYYTLNMCYFDILVSIFTLYMNYFYLKPYSVGKQSVNSDGTREIVIISSEFSDDIPTTFKSLSNS